ncbi:hypothetical protein JTB14_016727 [Gonioctena quinquepunctata]|nr:hypothetical protein JTB14_016727 [Gonioctena quinquepunctata]
MRDEFRNRMCNVPLSPIKNNYIVNDTLVSSKDSNRHELAVNSWEGYNDFEIYTLVSNTDVAEERVTCHVHGDTVDTRSEKSIHILKHSDYENNGNADSGCSSIPDNFKRVVIRGKGERGVAVLFSKDVQEHVLLSVRNKQVKIKIHIYLVSQDS